MSEAKAPEALEGLEPGHHAFKPAGPEWLEALHKAQKEAKQIERSKGIPDSRGKIKFFIAAAEDFTNESRRCLHAHGMGWFRVSTRIIEVNAHLGTLKLTGMFVVYHSPSGQAKTFVAEWTARSDGDALAGAHTRLTRRFVQGLLQIAVVDEGASPEDPPSHGQASGCSHPQHAVFPAGEAQWNAQKACWVSEMVCRACGADMGWGPCDAPQQQQQAFQAPAPAAAPAPAPAPPAQTYQAPAPAAPTPPAQTYQQPQIPVQAEPVVQAAMQILDAEPVSGQQVKEEMSKPPEAPAGTPGSPESWRDGLIEKGLDPENALQIAMLDEGRVVEPELVEQMRGWAWGSFNGNVEAITKAWNAVGFEPVPSLPLDQRPRPTGLQAKQFLSALKFKSATAGA